MLWQTSNLYKFGSHFVTSLYWLLGGVVGGATGAVARVTGWEGKFGGCCPGWENTELDGDVAGGGGCGEDAVDGESFVNCVWADALARNSAARNCSKWNCCRSWKKINLLQEITYILWPHGNALVVFNRVTFVKYVVNKKEFSNHDTNAILKSNNSAA